MATAIAQEAERAEEDIRKRILDLVGAGRPVPDDLLVAFSRAREAFFHELSSLRADEREAILAKEVAALVSRVEALEEGGSAKPLSQARQLLELGEKTRWLLWLSHAVAAEPHRDPLSFVETEMDWVERSARDLERWDKRLSSSAEKVVRKLDSRRLALLGSKFKRYVESPDFTDGAPAFDRSLTSWLVASESFAIEEAMALTGDSGATSSFDLERLRARRADHLNRCKACLKEASTAQTSLFVHAGCAELLDHSSAVLSESATAKVERRIPALRSLRKRIESFFHVISDLKQSLLRKDALPEEERKQRAKDFKLLERARRRCKTAEREYQASLRLEKLFGPRNVKLFESFILLLVFAFLALVLVEWELPASSTLLPSIYIADLVLCLFFQLDFLLRWAFAGWGGWYFARHFFFESLPALPYGLFFHYMSQARDLGPLEEVRAVIVLRLLGLRSVILLTVRILRVIFFFVRGTDRAVEKFRAFLDRDVVLFDPNPLGDAPESPLRRRILGAEERRQRALRSHYAETPWTERASILHYDLELLDMETCVCSALALPYIPVSAEAPGELHLERVIHRFLDCDASRVVSFLGHDGVERAARWLRFFDVPLIRGGPVVRRLIPAARIKNPPEAVAAAAHAMGQMLQNCLGAMRFWGDLSGITTGPQILDRMATAVIVASKRPAVRLLLFGGLFLFFKGLAQLVGVEFLEDTAKKLVQVLGLPLLILGTICLAILLTGRWLKRVAGEALDIYLRTADAHFYSLLKLWKLHRQEKDMQSLYRRVFLPEKKLRGNFCPSEEEWFQFLAQPASGSEDKPDFLPYRQDREAVGLLYRDFLDGPILHREDDKTSVQLLGNLVIQEIRFQTLGMTRKEMRKLEWLDLEKYRLLGLGPYFWFRFITESLAIETAKLVMEYNSKCIPLDQLGVSTPEAKERFRAFLGARGGEWDALRRSNRALQCLGEPLITDEFTSLNFLTADGDRDEIVRRRFGEEVLGALRWDRRGMVRDIFGTRPYNLLPRSDRVFNPYEAYQRYLSGAKFLFLPLFVALGMLRVFFACFRQVVRLVEEVLGKERSLERKPSRVAGFDVAIRKINRMRKPFFMEALKLRTRVDIEYLGLRLPGFGREEDGPGYREDLDFIGALESERRPIEELRNAALRDLRRFRNFLGEKGWLENGMEDLLKELCPSGELLKCRGEVVRALVTAYITDHEALRSTLTARAAARSFVEKALGRRETLGSRLSYLAMSPVRWLRESNRRRRSLLYSYLKQSEEFHRLSPRLHRKMLRAFLRSSPETEQMFALALEDLMRQGSGHDVIFEKLRRVAFDYVSWTRKVMKIRALQAITVLDIQSYRDLIWSVGGYAELA